MALDSYYDTLLKQKKFSTICKNKKVLITYKNQKKNWTIYRDEIIPTTCWIKKKNDRV